ncbi:TauD/TfdA family dioxygenase [Streptomyces sp. NPDC006333]|uniref:TauD/TfdA family dioxygenase n=1 Tax=Streptomyces sp. NPDC006333 TaxID=3156753 RepID=UPI0033B0E1B2
MNDLLILDADTVTHGPAAPRKFAAQLTDEGDGRALVRFTDTTDHPRNLALTLSLLSSLGTVLSVYPDDGCFSDLSVRTDADPGRTHGTGENRLHVDLVDRSDSPRYIALYCMRADPHGGGGSALSDLWAAAEALTPADRNLLRHPAFRYFTDEGVHGVGESIPRFAVLPPHLDGRTPIRFTSKMLPHLQRGELLDDHPHPAGAVAEAFGRLVEAAVQYRTTVNLSPGELLVFDQWRYAHGRMPLGRDQAGLPPEQRRLLKQAYVAAGGAR